MCIQRQIYFEANVKDLKINVNLWCLARPKKIIIKERVE